MAEETKQKLLEAEEVRQKVADLKSRVGEMAGYIKVEERRSKLAALEAEQASADFWSNQAKARETIAATNAERAYVVPFDSLSKTVEDAEVMFELAEAEEGEAREAALRDVLAECAKAEGFFAKLRLQSLLGGKFDQCNVFVKLHAGQGGTEAPAMQETRRRRQVFISRVGKMPWRRAWQPTPAFLPLEFPWTEEPGGLQSMGSQRVGHD